MNRKLTLLSKGMLIAGALLILAGVGWGIRERLYTPPPPVITDQGAVVLAVTAPTEPTPVPPYPTSAPTSAAGPTLKPPQSAATEDPTPELLPEWQSAAAVSATITQTLPETGSTSLPTAVGPATPSPVPTPVATRPPAAEGPPTRIVAPAIDLDSKVVPMTWAMVDHNGTMVSEWVVPSKAAGWHKNSALPGHSGNVVLSGHHNIEGKVFRYVVDLEPGDEIRLFVGDTPYSYTVAEKYILKEAGMPLQVRKKNAQWILPTEDERLTLVTCWPYQWPGNTHRVIVVARPAENVQSGP